VGVATTVFDLDAYTHDDFWSVLLLRREVGCREVERLWLYLPRKVGLCAKSGIESFVRPYARTEDQLQESQAEILARPPPLTES
jgi:hypothetical protein